VYTKKVKDLEFATLLRSRGYPVHEVEWEGKIAHFIFEDDNLSAEDDITRYINGTVTGDLRRFKEAEKSLKQMIYNHDGR